MERHRLFLLGRPEVVGSEGDVHIPFGKPLALLAHLAQTPRPVARDELGSLLWPDSDDRRARQSVREALSRIRRSLGDVFLSDDPVQLRPAALWVDLAAFDDALRSADLDAANVLWRGTFLEELEISDATAWTRWKEDTRTHLETRFGQALLREGDREVDAGDLSSAVRWYRRAAEVQPYSPEAHRRLLRTLLTLRRFDAWQEAWRRASRMLEPLDALDELRPLQEAFLRTQRAAREGRADGGGPTVPFAGRSEELRALLDAWRTTLDGVSRAVVLTGPTGVGKTRLAHELVARTQPRAAVVSVKPGEDGREDTLGLVRILTGQLRSLPGSPGTAPESDRLLHRIEESEPWDAPNDPATVARALEDLLGAVTFEAPLVLVVDDVHRADAASLLVLDELLRRTFDFPCLLLVLSREGEGSRRTEESLARWCVSPHVTCLPVRPLSRRSVGDVIESFSRLPDGPAAREILDQVHDLTQGNALFLVELMEALFQAGALRFVEGRWTFTRTDLSSVVSESSTVAALITTRLERLDPEARTVIAHLAQQDGPTPVMRLQRACGMETSAFVRAVAVLAERRIVRWVDDVRVDVAHDRFREVGRRLPATTRLLGRWGPRRLTAASVILLAATVLVGWLALNGGGNAKPYYGGGHLLVVGDTIVELVAEGRPGPWRVQAPDIWVPRDLPDGVWKPVPSVIRGGWVEWLAEQRDVDEAPFVVRLFRDGGVDTLYRTAGDEATGGISPDGQRYAVSTEDPATDHYDRMIVVATLGDGEEEVIFRNGRVLTLPRWSPDGRFLLTTSPGVGADSVVVLSRDGPPVAVYTHPGIGEAVWCGGSDRVALVRQRETESELVLWNVLTAEVEVLEDEYVFPSRLACSPDGRAVVFQRILDRRRRTVARDLERGVEAPVPLPESLGSSWSLHWIPEHPAENPVDLVLSEPPDSLRWGSHVQLETRLVFADGQEEPTPVTWSSTDPSVVRVDPSGRVFANRPGEAVIRADYQGWLVETARIRVTGEGGGPLLQERFERLDTTVWVRVGDPWPVADSLDGEPVLRLTGDGVWTDGVVTREAFDLHRGATLEMEFLLVPRARPDRQRVFLCLSRSEPPRDASAVDPVAWRREAEACVRYPAAEDVDFDPAAMKFRAVEETSLAFPGLLPSDGWVHAGIQLRPDGEVTFILDRRPVHTARVLLDNGPDLRWRVEIRGASVETDAFVRDVVLWEGPRYIQ